MQSNNKQISIIYRNGKEIGRWYLRVILKCEKDSFSRKGLLFLRKGLTLSVIGVKYGDNFTISILKMLLMVQSIKVTITCFYLSLLN